MRATPKLINNQCVELRVVSIKPLSNDWEQIQIDENLLLTERLDICMICRKFPKIIPPK